MNDPLVSIIIPCYNAAGFVGDAIRSALAQSYAQREVIVIDDGSTDESLEIVRSFGGAIRCETGPNRGGCAARNRGLELARGELVQFLDADDLLGPEKLERQVPLATKNPAELTYCNYATEIVGHRQVLPMQSPPYRGEDPVVFMARSTGLQTSAPLHWKDRLLEIGGFRPELPCSQERDLHLRLACAGAALRHVPESLFTARRVAGSVSSDSLRVLDQHANIAHYAYDMLERLGRLTDERAAALAGWLARDARQYLAHGQVDKARDYFAHAARLHQSGGIPQAYNRHTRLLYRLFGPVLTQRLVSWKRAATSAP